MQAWIGFRLLEVEVIEWADIKRLTPIAFFITCPYCNCKQWSRVDCFYKAADGTEQNLKCLKCGVCKPKLGSYWKRNMKPYASFFPKNTGWRSIIRED